MKSTRSLHQFFNRYGDMFSSWCSYMIVIFAITPIFQTGSALLAFFSIAAIAVLLVITAFWAYVLERNLQLFEGKN